MVPNDAFLLETIMKYCDDIHSAIDRFSLSEEIITIDNDFRALLAFFVQQIGETAGKLSEEFKSSHPEIEWKAIIGFRHRIVHAYGNIIPTILWDSAINDVPELQAFCDKILHTYGNDSQIEAA